MRMLLSLLAIATVAVENPCQSQEPYQKGLVGTWQAISRTESGVELAKEKVKTHRIVLTTHKMTVYENKESIGKTSYLSDPTHSPNHFDYYWYDEIQDDEVLILGIYKLQGDTLTICEGSPTLRPTAFESKVNSTDQVLTVYKRVMRQKNDALNNIPKN